VSDFIKDDNAAAILLGQLEGVRYLISDLEATLEEVERALAQPKIDSKRLKDVINSAMITIGQMKTFCP
jgi:hypothetical protein